MAKQEHLHILQQGVERWNAWREENPEIRPDLEAVNLYAEDLFEVNLEQADLRRAFLREADLRGTNFKSANLRGANLSLARLEGADLSNADLEEADLSGVDAEAAWFEQAHLVATNFQDAFLRNTSFAGSNLVATNFQRADLTGCSVYGISLWGVHIEQAVQRDLVITRTPEPTVTVDHLEVAQLVSLLLEHQTLRECFEVRGKKVVLILGHLTSNRSAFLSSLREELSRHHFFVLTLDVGPALTKDVTMKIITLANLARFILADLTDVEGLSQELPSLASHFPSIPLQPIVQADPVKGNSSECLEKNSQIQPIWYYEDIPDLLSLLSERFLLPTHNEDKEDAS